jgi:uncharacterized membrane-anchored protein YitT (DUF2179 family)
MMKVNLSSSGQKLSFIQSIKADFGWHTIKDYLYILAGTLVQAFAMRLFLVPGKLVSGGISGAAQLVNFYTHWPIGLMVFVGNAPLFVLGWRHLGGPKFVLRTAVAIAAFSFFTDYLGVFIPLQGITQDLFLTSLYGGIMLGIGLGLVYRGQGTSGGSDILGRILNHRFGVSISQAYLMTDSIVVLAAGFVFGWIYALYGLVMIYVSGLAAEVVTEGTSVFRTAMIVTNNPNEVAEKIMVEMERGVTFLSGRGAYTGTEREVVYCVVSRSEVSTLKSLVRETDPRAFMVIGEAHEALGEGFRPLK